VSFNPLGAFDVCAPLNELIVIAAKTFMLTLPEVPSGSIDRIYGHWTVGRFQQGFPDYNVGVGNNLGHFFLRILGDPKDNAIGVNSSAVHSATFMRNSGALSIATEDMVEGTEQNFGPQPLTMMAVEWLCAGIAAIAARYDIDLAGVSTRSPYAGEHTFLTHAEAANLGGDPFQYKSYGPPGPSGDGSERWDLASFHPLPAGLAATQEMATACGDAIRSRSRRYKSAIMARA
jgi:hypothetical protein